MAASDSKTDAVKALREALADVDPKTLAKALEDVTAESKRQTPQLGEPVVPSEDAQQH